MGNDLTFQGLLTMAHEAFLFGMQHLNLQGGTYPIHYEIRQARCRVETESGPIDIYTELPGRGTAAARFSQAGSVIIRVSIDGREEEFGLIDGQFAENVERECSRAILA